MKFPKIEDLILFEDEKILVLNKPPLLTSEKENSVDKLSLADIITKYCAAVMLCHRLDKDTSGAIMADKNEAVYRDISIMFQNRLIHKEYHALVEGVKK